MRAIITAVPATEKTVKCNASEWRTRHFESGNAIALTVGDGPEAPLPAEFLIYAAGVNKTQKGDFLFDEKAARDVMANYQREGVELMIDLNHDSLDDDVQTARADASDAMGWFTPQVKPDGSLWATSVHWSDEGARRLKAKLQRFISPAGLVDKKTKRYSYLINCALCSMPATYNAAPLVAASKTLPSDRRKALSLAIVALCATRKAKGKKR